MNAQPTTRTEDGRPVLQLGTFGEKLFNVVSPETNMAARKAAKRNNKDKTESDNLDVIIDENVKSIYFKTDCNNSLRTHPCKRSKLKLEETEESVSSTKLGRTFYNKPTENLAKELLGKLLYRVLDDGQVLCGRIVETEAYLGEIDKACHAYGGKRTERSEPMYMAPGTAYVYIIYGMYHCLNISSQEPGACVLIRALEPLQGGFSGCKSRL